MNSGTTAIIFRIVVLLIVAMGIYKLFFANDSPTRNVVFVNEEIGISGKVTGYNKARGFKIYINSSEVPYNFDSFQSREVAPNFSLGYYLEHGDSLTKSPNSSVVVVTRNGQVSEWHFVKPATPAQ